MERRNRDERMGGAAGAGAHPRGPPGRPLPPPPPLPQSWAPPPPPPSRFEPVDREKTCPLLLRVFTKNGGHHTQQDFAERGKEPKDEVQIYTWKDATLRELTDLVKEIAPSARRRNAQLSFAFVYPDKGGRFVLKKVGMTHAHGNMGRRIDDIKSLNELRFQIGDYLDVAIL
ncbi:histone deacetylase complex subunit SAP18-like [Argentina anserina]|uniref:histone deacetylase complex subunit SAP18-like n=1 Tax=Argentina anserina TaxID=57926 RepID=UPI00217664DC|nr:histone deacetylase complex subunit SAP18-like [Potentilla anserina]